MKQHLNRQQGAAIIVALFLTALVATAAIAMIARLQTDTHRTQLLLNNMQANQYAQGSLDWAIDALVNDWKKQQPGKLIDFTPIRSPISDMNGVKIYSIIYDAQGKFNLNNLTDAKFQQAFARLLRIVQPTLDQGAAQEITLNLANWITQGANNPQLDEYYTKQNPSYRAPHRPMVSVSEMRMVKGMNATLYTQLLPYVTALPDQTKTNINSVPIPVMMSFSPAVTLDIAKAVDGFRQKTPFANLDTLKNFPTLQSAPLAQSSLTVSSTFFMIQTNILQGNQHTTWYTLVTRILKNSQPIVVILWQSKGTL